MEVTTKELRIQPGKIIDQVSLGQEVTVTFRGKPLAKIIPLPSFVYDSDNDVLFGIWKDYSKEDSVEDQIRQMRKGRKF